MFSTIEVYIETPERSIKVNINDSDNDLSRFLHTGNQHTTVGYKDYLSEEEISMLEFEEENEMTSSTKLVHADKLFSVFQKINKNGIWKSYKHFYFEFSKVLQEEKQEINIENFDFRSRSYSTLNEFTHFYNSFDKLFQTIKIAKEMKAMVKISDHYS